jgi:hypothetical protein
MKNFIKNAIKSTGEVIKDGISVPITSKMFSSILKNQTEKIEDEGIYNIEVLFIDNYIKVTGNTKKLLLNIPFKIELVPSIAEQRTIKFEIRSMTPLNQDWIKKKIFNKPPFVSYENELLQIDLNAFETVKEFPLGQIRDFKIKDDKMWMKIRL